MSESMEKNRIVCRGSIFEGERLRAGSCFLGSSLPGDELAADTLEATVDFSALLPTLFQPADAEGLLTSEQLLFGVHPWYRAMVNDIGEFAYGDEVEYLHDGNLIGLFYLSSMKRVGYSLYNLSCISAMGLLANLTHYGGIYQNEPLQDVLSELLGTIVPHTLDTALARRRIHGWLPVASRRDNLQQLLFAVGGRVQKNADGMLHITTLSAANPAAIPDDRIYSGGSIEYPTRITKVSVTEHSYAASGSAEREILFEGDTPNEALVTPKGAAATGVLVTFSGPMYDLDAGNATILESGVNYAVLEGGATCVLTGKAYTHTMQVITRQVSGASRAALVDQKENEASVKNATLVNVLNGEAVATRVLSYYSKRRVISVGMVMGPERPGDPLVLTDPFGERIEAFVKSQDITISGVLAAQTELVSGYTPEKETVYEHSVLLTGSGSWRSPEEARRIHVVLISGGQGGPGGYSGGTGEKGTKVQDTQYRYIITSGTAGEGGKGASTGGSGGLVYEVDLVITPEQIFLYECGVGGVGGGSGGKTGVMGTPSTFGDLTSAKGSSRPGGVTDMITGEVYALPNTTPGVKGGRGSGSQGTGNTVRYNGSSWTPGAQGEEAYPNRWGGFGGGAAVGKNGGAGWDSKQTQSGHGGTGATPVTPEASTLIGGGGAGGHGGGGGGGSGGLMANNEFNYTSGEPGSPGSGGRGGTGGPGGIIIYW